MWPWGAAPPEFRELSTLSPHSGGEQLVVFVPKAIVDSGVDIGHLGLLINSALNPAEEAASKFKESSRSYVEGLGWGWSIKLDGGVLIIFARS